MTKYLLALGLALLLTGCVGFKLDTKDGVQAKGCLSPPAQFDIIKDKSLCAGVDIRLESDAKIEAGEHMQ